MAAEALAEEPAVPVLCKKYGTEERKYNDLADFFSIIKATEHLERAYMKDAIKEDEYTRECSKLIGHFKNMERTLLADKIIESTESFITENRMEVRMAKECLLVRGVPMTTLYHTPTSAANSSAVIYELSTALVSAQDYLSLGVASMDEFQPLIADVCTLITKVPYLPADLKGLVKIQEWLLKLNEMRAYENLDKDEVRQCLHDLRTLYDSFKDWLKEKGMHSSS